jgi:hypothetical protein
MVNKNIGVAPEMIGSRQWQGNPWLYRRTITITTGLAFQPSWSISNLRVFFPANFRIRRNSIRRTNK